MQQTGASPEEIEKFLNEHTMHRGIVQGDIDEGELPCGQGAGIIHGLKSASEVVETLVSEISLVMDGLTQKLPAL
jgi:NAD(P)H-dependent flavin oxidoreductase YrpB (nitropropane dioxygenase family)